MNAAVRKAECCTCCDCPCRCDDDLHLLRLLLLNDLVAQGSALGDRSIIDRFPLPEFGGALSRLGVGASFLFLRLQRDDLYMKLPELLLIDRRGGIQHQILRALVLRERDHVPDGVLSGQ